MDRKEAAKEIIKRHCNDVSCTDNCLYGKENCMYSMAIEALQEPERKKGQWLKKPPYGDYYCSVCHMNRPTYGAKLNYCSHCGADMRGEEE